MQFATQPNAHRPSAVDVIESSTKESVMVNITPEQACLLIKVLRDDQVRTIVEAEKIADNWYWAMAEPTEMARYWESQYH